MGELLDLPASNCNECGLLYVVGHATDCDWYRMTDTPSPTSTWQQMASHGLTLDKDGDGWDFASCLCGWISSPCPDVETAAEFYGDHRAMRAVVVTANVVKKAVQHQRRSVIRREYRGIFEAGE